VGARGATTALR